MPSKPQRVTNGHRAAVCGLVLAGVGLLDACKVAGISYRELQKSLPAGWHTPRLGRRPKWTAEKLRPVRRAWNSDTPLWQSAIHLRTTVAMMKFLARRERWPKRWPGPRRKHPLPHVAAQIEARA